MMGTMGTVGSRRKCIWVIGAGRRTLGTRVKRFSEAASISRIPRYSGICSGVTSRVSNVTGIRCFSRIPHVPVIPRITGVGFIARLKRVLPAIVVVICVGIRTCSIRQWTVSAMLLVVE